MCGSSGWVLVGCGGLESGCCRLWGTVGAHKVEEADQVVEFDPSPICDAARPVLQVGSNGCDGEAAGLVDAQVVHGSPLVEVGAPGVGTGDLEVETELPEPPTVRLSRGFPVSAEPDSRSYRVFAEGCVRSGE